MTRQLQPCGTHSAYQRHLYRGEEPCGPCRQANAERHRKGGWSRDISRAKSELREAHPGVYAELVMKHRGEHARQLPKGDATNRTRYAHNNAIAELRETYRAEFDTILDRIRQEAPSADPS